MAVAAASGATRWSAIVLTLVVPLLMAAGLTWFALATSPDDPGEWLIGLIALIPLEFIRAVSFWILRDAYKEYRSPMRAVRFFLVSLAAVSLICLIITVLELGPRDTLDVLGDARTWRVIGLPLALVALDGSIGLLCFRGDRALEAARLEAQGDDAQDWFSLALLAVPFVLIGSAVVFIVLPRFGSEPAWLPRGDEALFDVGALFLALYFAGKGLVLAQVHGARFQSTGRRVLSVPWVQFLLQKGADKRRANAAVEAKKAEERRAILAGAPRAGGGVAPG